MSILREAIEGRAVTEAVTPHDYVQLAFGSKVGITINNKMQIVPTSASIAALVGKVVTSVEETEERIEIRFLDGPRIEIDMRPDAWGSPEALVLHRVGLPTVVWN